MLNDTLTMIPGPTPVAPRILDALARPTTSHVAPSFVEEFRQALAGFRSLCRSESAQPFIVAGGGTLAMEMALVNVVAPGEKVLVLSHGYFGDRFGDLAAAFGIEAEVVKSEWGRAAEPAELARRLAAARGVGPDIRQGLYPAVAGGPVELAVELRRGPGVVAQASTPLPAAGADGRIPWIGGIAALAISAGGIGAKFFAMATFSSSWATVSQPTITVLTGSVMT